MTHIREAASELENVLEVKELSVSFQRYGGGLSRDTLDVISGLSLTARAGEILAVIGHSGAGKSLLAHAILGILPKNAVLGGELLWFGRTLTAKLQKELRRGQLAFVPQSVTYLDPLMRVGRQISGNKDATTELLSRYHLEPGVARLFPHELSGGMTRRVMICTALAGKPRLVIADEPTPGLPARLAEHAMLHFREIAQSGSAVLLITHDLELAIRFADRIAVLFDGAVAETVNARDFGNIGGHPYSRALLTAMPQNGFSVDCEAFYGA